MKHLWADRLSLIGKIPLMYYNKEKASLNSLPADNIRKPYQITTNTVKVNHSSMFNYKGCQYSVPPEYIDKIVSLQVYDGYIHAYCNTEFITIHQLSSKKLNYIPGHYAAIARKSHIFRDEQGAWQTQNRRSDHHNGAARHRHHGRVAAVRLGMVIDFPKFIRKPEIHHIGKV